MVISILVLFSHIIINYYYTPIYEVKLESCPIIIWSPNYNNKES